MDMYRGIVSAAIIALAAFLLRLYRREATTAESIESLQRTCKAHDGLSARMQRVELVVGIDPAAGGGLASQIESLAEEIALGREERGLQNKAILDQMSALTKEVSEMRHALDRRVLALELTGSGPTRQP